MCVLYVGVWSSRGVNPSLLFYTNAHQTLSPSLSSSFLPHFSFTMRSKSCSASLYPFHDFFSYSFLTFLSSHIQVFFVKVGILIFFYFLFLTFFSLPHLFSVSINLSLSLPLLKGPGFGLIHGVFDVSLALFLCISQLILHLNISPLAFSNESPPLSL